MHSFGKQLSLPLSCLLSASPHSQENTTLTQYAFYICIHHKIDSKSSQYLYIDIVILCHLYMFTALYEGGGGLSALCVELSTTCLLLCCEELLSMFIYSPTRGAHRGLDALVPSPYLNQSCRDQWQRM